MNNIQTIIRSTARSLPTLGQSSNLKAYKMFISNAISFLSGGRTKRQITISFARRGDKFTLKLLFRQESAAKPGWENQITRTLRNPSALAKRMPALKINRIEIESGVKEEELQRLINCTLNSSSPEGLLDAESTNIHIYYSEPISKIFPMPDLFVPIDPNTIEQVKPEPPPSPIDKSDLSQLSPEKLLGKAKRLNRQLIQKRSSEELRVELTAWIGNARARIASFNRGITRSSKRLPERHIYLSLLDQMQKFQRQLGMEPEKMQILWPRDSGRTSRSRPPKR